MPKKLSKTNTSISPNPTSTPATSSAQLGTTPTFLTDNLPLPRLFVFDLDYTLWPFWVDTHVTPPLKPVSSSSSTPTTAATDRTGDTFAFYSDVPSILSTLSQTPSLHLGVASRTTAPDLARELLKLLHVSPAQPQQDIQSGKKSSKPRRALDLFDAGLEIYPTTKKRHMEALVKRTGVRYEDILFFDDETRNRDVETLGVTMWLVRDGVTWKEVGDGVREWRSRRGIS
jgi:magnesium-dependent phosphatase 1